MTPSWYVRPLGPDDQGEDVLVVQHLLRCEPTGVYDPPTAAKVRGYRTLRRLGPGRGVDEHVARALGELR